MDTGAVAPLATAGSLPMLTDVGLSPSMRAGSARSLIMQSASTSSSPTASSASRAPPVAAEDSSTEEASIQQLCQHVIELRGALEAAKLDRIGIDLASSESIVPFLSYALSDVFTVYMWSPDPLLVLNRPSNNACFSGSFSGRSPALSALLENVLRTAELFHARREMGIPGFDVVGSVPCGSVVDCVPVRPSHESDCHGTGGGV